MIPRHALPQIPKDEIDTFRDFLIGYDVPAKFMMVPVRSLRPIQKHVNKDKVKKFMKDDKIGDIPLIVTSKGQILDGHHRWLAIAALNPESKMLCLVCDCPLRDLVELGHEFEPSFTKTVQESTIYCRLV